MAIRLTDAQRSKIAARGDKTAAELIDSLKLTRDQADSILDAVEEQITEQLAMAAQSNGPKLTAGDALALLNWANRT